MANLKENQATEIDVLLTYPADSVRLFDSMVPLGIASIAAVLDANCYKVKIIDFNHYRGDYRKDLRRWQPKIVGIGGTTSSRAGSFLTARLTKEVLPAVPVVFGGPHASFSARDTLTHVLEIDYVVKGEGEYSFLGLCDLFIRHKPVNINTLSGVCHRSLDDIVENPVERIDNLDDLPLPARHLFQNERSAYNLRLDIFNLKAEFLMTSRGCPAHCTFCSASRMFSGGVRLRSMEHIRREVDMLMATNRMHALKLFDSTFTADPGHVEAFCDMIGPYGILWECEVRADSLSRSMLYAMKRSGCVYVNVGLETANKQVLAKTGKNISAEQVEQCLGWCRDIGIGTKVFMIFGHLDQTFEDCLQDIAYINRQRTMIDFFATTFGLRVYPGTPLETLLKKRQLIAPDFSWVKFKPGLKNLLVFETGNVLILDQRGLGLYRLFWIIMLLARQKTLTSGAYILKMLAQNAWLYLDRLFSCVIHFQHKVSRGLEKMVPAAMNRNNSL